MTLKLKLKLKMSKYLHITFKNKKIKQVTWNNINNYCRNTCFLEDLNTEDKIKFNEFRKYIWD
jgi:hypothetical protein